MNLILQTDPRLYPAINQYGCFFRDCQALAEIEMGKALITEQINASWDYAKSKGWLTLDSQGYYQLRDPVSVINYTLSFLGSSKTAVNTMVDNADGTKWPEVLGKPYKYIFQTNHSGSSDGVHYRLYDYDGNLIFDPYPGLNLGVWVQRSYYNIY